MGMPDSKESVDPTIIRVPVHVAIIMDGNGRWAKARGLPRIEGHRRGAEAVRRVVRGAEKKRLATTSWTSSWSGKFKASY